MQFESRHCVFKNGTTGALSPSPYFHAVAAVLRDTIIASQQGAVSFEKGTDFVVTPLLFARNREYRDDFNRAVADCRALGCDAVLVVGIGGSSLGASAVYEALGRKSVTPLYFLETIDPDQFPDLERLMTEGGAVHVVIISKSGTTLETMINSSFAIDMLRKQRPQDWHFYVTIISDMESSLSQFAEKEEFRWLGIPEAVGGRFSVFSLAGLFPLALAGIDVKSFCDGACEELASFAQQFPNTRAAVGAQLLATAQQSGYWVHDTFLWDVSLEALGKWYRQLCAESLGRRENAAGNLVEMGILPTVSIGTQDLHSMLQLYLGGPRQIVTTFVESSSFEAVAVPNGKWAPVHGALDQCSGKDLGTIRQAIIKAVQAAYAQDNRPFMMISMEKTARDLGQFMMTKMLEVVLTGILLGITPFGQPEVEKYKQMARQFLADI